MGAARLCKYAFIFCWGGSVAVTGYTQTREVPLGFVLAATPGAALVPRGSHVPLQAVPGDFLFAGDSLLAENSGSLQFYWCTTGPNNSHLFRLEQTPRDKALVIGPTRPALPNGKGGYECVLPALARNPEVASVPKRTDVEAGAASLASIPAAIQAYQGPRRTRLDALLRGDLNDPRQRLLLATSLQDVGLLREAAAEYLELAKTWTQQPRLLKLALDLEHPGPASRTLTLPPPEKPPEGKGTVHAFVIGISAYLDRTLNLQFADRDAAEFAAYMITPRGGATDVKTLLNDEARISRIRNEFTDMLTRLKPEDTLVIFIASHGDTDKTTDMPRVVTYLANRQEPGINAMPLTEIRKFMLGETAPYRDARVFLDVCHSGDVALLQPPRRASQGKRTNPSSREIAAAPDFFALTATNQGDDAYAYEDKLFDNHGVFTYFLLRALNTHDATSERLLTYGALAHYVSDHVEYATWNQQFPAMTSATAVNHVIADLNQGGLPSFDHTPYDKLRLQPEKLQRQAGRRTPVQNENPPPTQPPSPDATGLERRVELEDQGEAILLRYLEGDSVPQKKPAFADCARIFSEALALQPGSPYLQARHDFCEGRAQIFDKSYPTAIQSLEGSIRLDPTAAYAYNALGIAYLEQANYRDAILAFQDAIQRAPRWVYPRHNLALAFTEDGNFDQAIRTYRIAMDFAPNYFYLPYGLGVVYERINRLQEAAVQYETAKMRAPNRAEPVTAQAMLMAVQGNRKEAIKALRGAVDMPNQELNATQAARHDLAVLLWADPATREEALSLWQTNGPYPSSQLSLAEALEDGGRLRGAARVYREILADHPDHTSARLNLAALLEESGHPSAAIDELKTALQLLPDNPVILEKLGRASAQAGETAAARAYYEGASARTADATARKRIRQSIRALGRRK
jgi:tetratricopeptide (TPR) repeat protein